MKGQRGLARLLAVASAMVALVVVGGATTGRAATSFDITLAPLIGTTNVNEIPQVSYGGKIGYHLHIQNNDTSNTQHASVRVTSTLATFSDSDDPSCALNPNDAHEMVCTPFGGTFGPGAIFDVDLRFTAPATGPNSGETVETCASITVSAQTVKNGNKNNGTTVATTCPNGFDGTNGVLTNVVTNTDKADTYLHKNETAKTGNVSLPSHPQNFSVNTPKDKLLGDPFGIAISIHDNVGAPAECTANSTTECFGANTQLTIPAASFVNALGNPFYDGTTFNPYAWAMNAQYPQGNNFKLHGVYHVDDNGAFQQLLSCNDPLVGGAPSVAYPLCYDTLDQLTNKRTLVATGRGLENGNVGWN
jgi:hypothetical protein